jgi:dephospho-CoA kinase
MKKIIAVTGLPGAGKTAVSRIINQREIPVFITGDITREEMTRRGMEHSNENSEKIARQMREEFGMEFATKKSWEKAEKMTDEIVCLEGLRDIHELRFLKEQGKTMLIVVSAPDKVRYDRLVKGKGYKHPKNFEEFVWRSENEAERGMQELMNTQEIKKYTIINDGSLEELGTKVDKILEYIRKL